MYQLIGATLIGEINLINVDSHSHTRTNDEAMYPCEMCRAAVINFLSSLSSLMTWQLQFKFNSISICFDHERNIKKRGHRHKHMEIAPPNVVDHTMQNEFWTWKLVRYINNFIGFDACKSYVGKLNRREKWYHTRTRCTHCKFTKKLHVALSEEHQFTK